MNLSERDMRLILLALQDRYSSLLEQITNFDAGYYYNTQGTKITMCLTKKERDKRIKSLRKKCREVERLARRIKKELNI
jgi:hypothetical protein